MGENSLRGVVLKVDKFGNLITNIAEQEAPALFASPPPPFDILISGQTITRLRHSYAEGDGDEFFAIVGSSGYIEIPRPPRPPRRKSLRLAQARR